MRLNRKLIYMIKLLNIIRLETAKSVWYLSCIFYFGWHRKFQIRSIWSKLYVSLMFEDSETKPALSGIANSFQNIVKTSLFHVIYNFIIYKYDLKDPNLLLYHHCIYLPPNDIKLLLWPISHNSIYPNTKSPLTSVSLPRSVKIFLTFFISPAVTIISFHLLLLLLLFYDVYIHIIVVQPTDTHMHTYIPTNRHTHTKPS